MHLSLSETLGWTWLSSFLQHNPSDIIEYLQDKLEAPKEVEKKKRRGRRPENRRHISKSKGQSKKKSRLQKNSARLCRVLA